MPSPAHRSPLPPAAYPATPLRRPRALAPAFSLIELLIVLGIITLLVALSLPCLSAARRSARRTRELTTGQQLLAAYHVYANDHKSEIMPGYASPAMVSGSSTSLKVFDEKNTPITGVIARRYPWRIAPYLDFNFAGLYDNAEVLSAYRERADFQYVVSLSPSLGLNADFVGGKGEPGFAFNPVALRTWGRWYITRTHEARRPADLITFASARGRDPFNPTSGTQPGFYLVDAPRFTDARWIAGAFSTDAPPESFGYVDPRWSGKAVTAHFDGHAALTGFEDLQDMRRWSDRATTQDWSVTPVIP
ncbi:hypothetical protein BH11PLA1_BH11PLA1_09620 [soil metagenome]